MNYISTSWSTWFGTDSKWYQSINLLTQNLPPSIHSHLLHPHPQTVSFTYMHILPKDKFKVQIPPISALYNSCQHSTIIHQVTQVTLYIAKLFAYWEFSDEYGLLITSAACDYNTLFYSPQTNKLITVSLSPFTLSYIEWDKCDSTLHFRLPLWNYRVIFVCLGFFCVSKNTDIIYQQKTLMLLYYELIGFLLSNYKWCHLIIVDHRVADTLIRYLYISSFRIFL